MKLFEKIMDAMGLYEEEDDLLDEKLEVKEPLQPSAQGRDKAERPNFFRKKQISFAHPETKAKEENDAPVVKEKKKVLPVLKKSASAQPAEKNKMGTRTLSLPVADRAMNVVVLEPASFDDSQKIADYLRGSEPVVVNFKGTDNVVAKRMTDFISGTIYALGGSMKKLGRDILICAPKNVDIDAGEEVYDERGEQPWKK